MSQVVPSVARFELKYRNLDTTMENVYYARTSAATWDVATMDAVEAAFEAWETDVASDFRNSSVSLYEIIATDLTSLFGIRKAYDVSPNVFGALGDPLPSNATIALKADIGRRGRGTAGRSFWIGLSDTQLVVPGDQISAGHGVELVDAMNLLVASIAGIVDVEGLCIPHFVVDDNRPPVVDADITVRYLLSDFFLDSQRDRLPNHKKHKRVIPR